MENNTYYLVHQPGTNLHEEFETYHEAWEFSELYFKNGHGVAIVEQVTRRLAK